MFVVRCLSPLLFLAFLASAEVIVPVSPGGPFATLAAARDKVRELRRAGELGPVRVEFAPGTYPQIEPVVFAGGDSGTPAGPTTYAAAPGAQVRLSGGHRITGWEEADKGLWRARLTDATWRFEQLWINGRRAQVARTPNQGYFSAYSPAGKETFADMTEPNFQAFIARPRDFAILKDIAEADRQDVLLTIMQTWTVGQCRIQALNSSANAIRIVGRARYPFVKFEPDQRWYLENFLAALDEPGEWFLTREGVVLYKPLPGEDMTTAEVIGPVSEKLIVLAGDAAKRELIHDISFEGLSFVHGQALYGPSGHHDGQAAAGVGAMIEMNGVTRIRFNNCEAAHTGGYAVWFNEACSHSSVIHSHLHDLGGGGVRIGSLKLPNDVTLTHHITVDDCIIQHAGRRYPSACGIFLAHAADCTVTHNDIGDLYYTGISAGWIWGYQHSPSKRNRFDFNHIHHLGWGVLSDMGGFYGLGRAEGTTVSNNYVHDIASYRYGGWGLYTDEGSTGVTLENNLVHDTSESTFHQHYGKWNQVSNNIFAFGRKAQIQRSRPEKHASFAYERNIVVFDIPNLLDGTWYNWEAGTLEMRDNLYWNSAKLPVTFLDTDLAGWQKKTGRDEGSLVANPLFRDVSKRDFRLSAESPALKLGFKPFDPSLAGVRGKDAWRQLAARATFPDFEARSKPWPQPDYELSEGFEDFSLGMPSLPRAEIHWQNKGDNIAVSDDQAASGKHSLKVTDAPGLDRSWDPHLVLKPKYIEGTVTASFDMRTEAGAKGFIEWRGEGQSYTTGPSLWFEDNKLIERKSKTSLDISPGAWTHVEMIAGLGSKASGKWTLRLTTSGGAPREFKDLPCDPEWIELQWLGFVSTATEKTSFWLDNLKVSRTD